LCGPKDEREESRMIYLSSSIDLVRKLLTEKDRARRNITIHAAKKAGVKSFEIDRILGLGLAVAEVFP
jgi:hypothetical protein